MNTAPPIVSIRSLGCHDPAEEEAAGYVLSGLPVARDVESMPDSWKVVELLLRRTLSPCRKNIKAYERYGYLPLWAAVNLELLLEELEQAGVRVEGS